ncbi:MAG TPA: hypothetical protein VKU02_31050 [Gemmataceae bacterium]|nr:hypothetical protein [Gemmataceae bacterium]
MRFASYLQNVRRFLKRSRSVSPTKPPRRALALEALEYRQVPSILFQPGIGVTASDWGGPVINNVHAELVFWGNSWNFGSGPALRQTIQSAIDGMLQSPYLTALSEYRGSIGAGQVTGWKVDSELSPGATFNDFDPIAMLQLGFRPFGPLPDPFYNADPNRLYVVIPPPGSQLTGGAVEHDGYHAVVPYFAPPFGFPAPFNFAVVSNDGNVDDVTKIVSHEIIEAVSDPVLNAIHTSEGDFPNNELCDNHAQNYAYRPNGVDLLQAWFSQANDAFIVPTDQAQNFLVKDGTLIVNGDQLNNINDTITLDVTDAGGIRATLNGEVAEFDKGAINGITVNSGGGNDQIHVLRTIVDAPVSIVSGGTATVVVGHDGTVQDILGAVNIENSTFHGTALVVDDSADTLIPTVKLDSFTPASDQPWGRISGLANAPISYEYDDTSSVTIHTGFAGFGYGMIVNVQSTGVPTSLIGHGPCTVNVGNASKVEGIQGALTIQNPLDHTTLMVDDSNDSQNRPAVTADTISIAGASFGQIEGLGAEPIQFKYADTQSLTLKTGMGGASVYVLGTGVPTTLVGYTASTVKVGNAGKVEGIQGALTIQNPPNHTTLTVDDRNDSQNHSAVTIDTISIAGASYGQILGLGAATIQFKYVDTQSVTLHTGMGGASVYVLGTGVPTTLVGHTAGTVKVGNAGKVEDIKGALTILNPASHSTVTVDDTNDTMACPNVVVDTQQLIGVSYGRILGLGTAEPIQFDYNHTQSLTLHTGMGGATVNVLSTAVPTMLVGHADSIVNVGNSFNGVQDIYGALTILNPPAHTVLNVNDGTDHMGRNATVALLTGLLPLCRIQGLAPAAITFGLYDVNALNLTTGTGNDTLTILSILKSYFSLTLSNAGGNDTIIWV